MGKLLSFKRCFHTTTFGMLLMSPLLLPVMQLCKILDCVLLAVLLSLTVINIAFVRARFFFLNGALSATHISQELSGHMSKLEFFINLIDCLLLNAYARVFETS